MLRAAVQIRTASACHDSLHHCLSTGTIVSIATATEQSTPMQSGFVDDLLQFQQI